MMIKAMIVLDEILSVKFVHLKPILCPIATPHSEKALLDVCLTCLVSDQASR